MTTLTDEKSGGKPDNKADSKTGNLAKKLRLPVDIVMTVMLPLLMAYSLVGEMMHEVLGTVMMLLFILHHVINRKWWTNLFKGKYTPLRTFHTIVNLLLLVYMILQPVSGILMSKHLYTFIQVPGLSASARQIHLAFAYWGLGLMCIHAGTHMRAPFKKMTRKSKTAGTIVFIISTIISLYGLYAFVKRGFPGYMFLIRQFAFFDPGELRVFFFLDYIAIMILFGNVGYRIDEAILSTADKGGNHGRV